MTRTVEEIKARIDFLTNNTKEEDFFGFQRGDLIEFLTFEEAKPYLKPDASSEAWAAYYKEPTRENAIEKIKDYMNFAWDTANDCRGLSADRSIQHMLAWTWVVNDGFHLNLKTSYDEHYEYYGKPQLVLICEFYGIDWKALDNNKWVNDEMEEGITAEQYYSKKEAA